MVRNYQNADCSFKKLIFCPFTIIFGTILTVLFPMWFTYLSINSLKELIWRHRWRVVVMHSLLRRCQFTQESVEVVRFFGCWTFAFPMNNLGNRRIEEFAKQVAEYWYFRSKDGGHSTERLRRFVSWHLYLILQCRYHLLQVKMLNYIVHEPGHKCFYEEYSVSKYSRLAILFLLVHRACPIMFVVFTPRWMPHIHNRAGAVHE